MYATNRAQNQLKQFLACHRQGEGPVLAAISGGGDSLALLHALIELKTPCHVAHVDHGWREGSAQEAAALKKLVPVPFHHRRVEGPADENSAREIRHAFFRELCAEHRFEAVLLAHHADDRAETVFKRAVEGAPLVHLSGPRGVQRLPGLTLWRPFLGLAKAELTHPWEAVVDPTNEDPRYHRGLLRSKVFPLLGRPVGGNLARLGAEAEELCGYLDAQVEPLLQGVVEGPFGRWLDLSEERLHRVELRHLLRRFCPGLSREQLDLVGQLLWQPNRRVGPMVVDRGHLFVPVEPRRLPERAAPLAEGAFGPYWVERVEAESSGGWRDLWRGEAVVCLPEGEWRLCAPYPDARLRARFNADKVPTFLREQLPVVRGGDGRCVDFLTRWAAGGGESWKLVACEVAGRKGSGAVKKAVGAVYFGT